MYCPYCGKENKGDSRFCTGCGKELTGETGTNQNTGIDTGSVHQYADIEADGNAAVHKRRSGKVFAVIAVVLAVLLAAGTFFGRSMWKSHQWKEYYDLGSQYLTENNYEEAVVAFTNAIEVDEKKPEAYVGRGDAYAGCAEYALKEERKDEAISFYEKAEKDYETAVNLGDKGAEELADNVRMEIEEAQYISEYLSVLRWYQEANKGNKTIEELDESEVSSLFYYVSADTELYYTLKDMNNDSIPELFISIGNEYRICGMYMVSDGNIIKPFDLWTMGERTDYTIRTNNIIACAWYSGAYNNSIELYTFEDGAFSPKTIYYASYDGWDGDRYFAGSDSEHQDTEISEQDWNDLENKYPADTGIEWHRIDDLEPLGIR